MGINYDSSLTAILLLWVPSCDEVAPGIPTNYIDWLVIIVITLLGIILPVS